MSISCQKRTATAYHGLHLVPNTSKPEALPQTAYVYRIAAVGAALFLAMTVC